VRTSRSDTRSPDRTGHWPRRWCRRDFRRKSAPSSKTPRRSLRRSRTLRRSARSSILPNRMSQGSVRPCSPHRYRTARRSRPYRSTRSARAPTDTDASRGAIRSRQAQRSRGSGRTRADEARREDAVARLAIGSVVAQRAVVARRAPAPAVRARHNAATVDAVCIDSAARSGGPRCTLSQALSRVLDATSRRTISVGRTLLEVPCAADHVSELRIAGCRAVDGREASLLRMASDVARWERIALAPNRGARRRTTGAGVFRGELRARVIRGRWDCENPPARPCRATTRPAPSDARATCATLRPVVEPSVRQSAPTDHVVRAGHRREPQDAGRDQTKYSAHDPRSYAITAASSPNPATMSHGR